MRKTNERRGRDKDAATVNMKEGHEKIEEEAVR